MKTTSNIEPENITPDWGSLANGKMDLLIHWDVIEKTGTTPDDQTYTYWEYQEERIRVDVPNKNQVGIEDYINANYDKWLRIVGVNPDADRLSVAEDLLAAIIEGGVV